MINQGFERGYGGVGVTLEKTSTRSFSSFEDDSEQEDEFKSDVIPTFTTAHQRDDDFRNQFPPDGKQNQTRSVSLRFAYNFHLNFFCRG